MQNVRFKWLVQPIRVGPLLLSNRMVRGPVHSNLCLETGEVSQQLIDMYEFSARNGPSLIVIEATAVDGRHTGKAELRIDDRRFEPGLHRLVEAIHVNGVPVVIQLRHQGMWGNDPVSPSGVACYGMARKTYVQPRVMSLAEAEEARDLFVAAAVRAKNIEFDGVVLHGAVSYLLQQFVSPHTNRREDRYGGSLENRCAMPLEIVRGIRQKCGLPFPIGYSLAVDEFLPDGITPEESLAFAKSLEREGVNWVDLTVGSYETSSSHPKGGLSYRQEKGFFELLDAFKKALSIPVFARCRGEHDPSKWEETIKKGQCDVIQMGRPLLCDPELPRKIAQDRLDDIRQCIRCNYCFETGTIRGWQVSCALNPSFGRDRDYAIERIGTHPKRVLVVGGGPGGLEAARVAALRGHKVTLMEKEATLGGNLRIASLPPGKEGYQKYFGDWLERQCEKAGVRIELNKEVTAGVVEELKPDVVIIATGATPLIPAIRGIDNRKNVVTAADVLTGKASVGKKVVVAGGGEVGIETADFITSNGMAESVTIVEMLAEIGSDMTATNRTYMLTSILPRSDVKMFTNMHIAEITDEGIVADDKEWKQHKFEGDTIVLALGYTANTALYEALKDKVPELYRIGDCAKPRNIADAVREGAYVARQI